MPFLADVDYVITSLLSYFMMFCVISRQVTMRVLNEKLSDIPKDYIFY